MRIHPFTILAIFIVVPLIEIALLIQLGSVIGLLATIGIVIATAVIGTSLLRSQGFGVLARANQTMQSGKVPVEPVVEGVLLLIAGAFLLTPGLLTDAFGFSLLAPFIRRRVAGLIVRNVVKSAVVNVHVRGMGPGADSPGSPFDDEPDQFEAEETRHAARRRSHGRPGGETVIDGEFERLDERTQRPKKT